MDQQGTTIAKPGGVEADRVYLAPMTERPRSYTCDLPPGAARTNTVNMAHRVLVHDARPIAAGLSLDREGFELVEQRSTVRDFYDGRAVLSPRGAFEDRTAPADVLPCASIALPTIAVHSA
jgi:hypothetical protein